MPGEKPGTAASQLSEAQIRELVEWADATPGANEGPVLLEKLRSLGVQCGLNAAYTFREKRITPALEMIRSARLFAEQLGQELSVDQANLAHGSNMVAQQMVFDWMVESKRKGVSLDDPETAKHFKRLFAIVAEGMNAKDRSTLTEARVKKLETQLAQAKAQQEAAAKELQKLNEPATVNDAARRAAVLAEVDRIMGIKHPATAAA